MAVLDEVLQTLEIQPTGIPTVVRLSQNENGRQIRLTLRGNEDDFPAGCLVTIAGTKPDGVVYSAEGELDGNVAVINEDTQMTAVPGMWKARVQVTYGGSTIATELIVFEVYADPVDPDSVPSESEITGLVAQAQYWAENAKSSAYGSPLTASTAAEMTETDRVYVYTGSESGYSNGHWYYYDGTAWQDGGVYNAAAVQTDTTLSVSGMAADAKATGDAITAETTRATDAETAIAADVETALTTKADKDGNYVDLTAGTALAVLSDSYTEDAVPYKFRRTPYKSRRLMDSITGGTVAWNQLCNGASVSVPNGHKYLSKIADAWTIGASTGAAITGLTAGADMVIDLTAMFCPTIADYIYNLEQSTAGAGVALFRSLFGASYYPYNAGELISISGLSARKTVGFNAWDEKWENGGLDAQGQNSTAGNRIRTKNYIPVASSTVYYLKSSNTSIVCYYDANKNFLSSETVSIAGTHLFTTLSDAHYIRCQFGNNNDPLTTYKNDICINISDTAKNGTYEPYEAHTYPLDSTLTLRGIPKLDSNNKLYFDGDRYASDGTVTRRYGIVDLGTLNWTYYSGEGHIRFYATLPVTAKVIASGQEIPNLINVKYIADTYYNVFNDVTDKTISVTASGQQVAVYDTAYTDAATFKTAMSGVYLVYELATPTTETASPYQAIQACDPDGTEEYVSTTVVPVGHESKYYKDIISAVEGIPDAPAADGTYTLKVTVTDGVPVYSWE